MKLLRMATRGASSLNSTALLVLATAACFSEAVFNRPSVRTSEIMHEQVESDQQSYAQ